MDLMRKLPMEVEWEITEWLDAKSKGKLGLTCKRLSIDLAHYAIWFFIEAFDKHEKASGEIAAADEEEFELKVKALFRDAENYLEVQIDKNGLRVDLGLIGYGFVLINRMSVALAYLNRLHEDNEPEKEYIKEKVQKLLSYIDRLDPKGVRTHYNFGSKGLKEKDVEETRNSLKTEIENYFADANIIDRA